jgi:polar amino acid transport system substrate-binding protein
VIGTFSVLARVMLAAAVLAALAGDQWPDQPAAPALVAGSAAPVILRPAAGHSPAKAPATSDCTSQNLRASLRPPAAVPAPGQMPAGSTMARIAKQGYLIVGVLADTFPFSFRDASLRPEGFDIDVARDIAGALFGDSEKVVFRPLREVARLEALLAGQVDLVIAAVTITCRRRELVNFSTVYFEAGQRVLVNRSSGFTSLADLRGKRVCAARGSTSLGTILSYPSKPIPVGAATETDCLMLLQLGNVDAVSTDDTELVGMAAQDSRTDIVGPPLTEEPYGVAISKAVPDLVRFVNAVLERRVQDGRWRASYERWLTRLGPPPSPPAPQYRD